MKKLLVMMLAGALLCAGDRALAQESKNAKTQLEELVTKVKEQLGKGKESESDLAPLLKEFDALLAQHKSEKTEDVAQIAFMKALLYAEVLDDTDKAVETIQQLKTDFPETSQGKSADQMIASFKKQSEAKKIQKSLVAGSEFPDFAEKDLDGKPLSIANYKGKVVLVDFWATWCGPCVGELPNVLKTYQKHHEKGFEIIGISLDKDEGALKSFLKKNDMNWAQFFDGQGWQNKLAGKYGVNSIPATYLLDGQGKILAKNLRGEALEKEVARVLSK